MEKPHVEISVANDPKKENQANKKEIQEPNININYDMPYTSGSSTIDNHLKNARENEKQNVYIVQPQEAEYSIYLNIRNMFILKVFGILLFQLAFTFAIVLICQINIIKDFLFSQNILAICLICIATFVYLVLFIIFLCKPTLMRRVPTNYIIT